MPPLLLYAACGLVLSLVVHILSLFGIAFGGFKQSGIGREGGTEGLLPFLEAKTLLLEEWPSHMLTNSGLS